MDFDLLAEIAKGVVLGDGAMGTQIQAARLPAVLCPEEYNLTYPEAIESIHRAYVKAGSQIILTNTFGCSSFKLRRGGGDPERAEEIALAGCQIARRAAGDRVGILGDIGPSGEVMEPFGEIPAAELKVDYARQARTLAAGGVDAIIIETIMDLNEMEVALEAVLENTALPVITSMAFGEGGRTTFGNSVEECGSTLTDMGASMLAANCMVSIEHYPDIVRGYRSVSELPIMAQPNAGQPETQNGGVVYRESPESMAARLPALVDAGVSVVGGCCGTTPETIRAFREVLQRLGEAA